MCGYCCGKPEGVGLPKINGVGKLGMLSAVSNAIQRGVDVEYGAEFDGSISRL